jgi:hypothetical protein
MIITHAFQENRMKDMNEHLEQWFGIVPIDLMDYETGAYLACYCGAWIVPLQKTKNNEILVGAVWHTRKYKKRES